jgi:proteasome activator subunit 4
MMYLICPYGLQKKFQKSASLLKTKRQQARDKKRDPLTPEEIDQGHSAILGLCAFVDTHPYHVPAFLPDVLVILTTHLHDPQPIPVKATLDCTDTYMYTVF